MKKYPCFVIVILVVIFLLAQSINAAPTIFGPTGLIAIPTAESVKYKELSMAVDFIFAEALQQDWYYKMNLGTFEGCELGLTGGRYPEEGVFLNLKYYLMSDQARYPLSFAIGLENLTSLDNTSVYLVASKRFKGGLSAHLGFRSIFTTAELDPSIMGGIEYMLSNQLSILADFNGERKVYILNAGLHYYVTNDFSVRAAILDISNNRNSLFYTIGTSYSIFL
ncbi:MAG: YjbH domain-containing protein [bacterium]|nr:YjbH domain-containing protein [bacterium]